MKIIRKYFWFMPAVIWMYVIFSFSDQVGEASAGLSLKVTEKVVEGLAARTYSGSGRTFLAKIQFVIWLEEDPEVSDESVPAAEEDTDAEEDTAASPAE